MLIKQPPRVFRTKINDKNVDLADPNLAFSIKDVIGHYSILYPQITNAKVKEPFFEDDKLIYELDSEVGYHG